MTTTETSLPQRRELRTAIPGPNSQALQARRSASVSAGVASTMPGTPIRTSATSDVAAFSPFQRNVSPTRSTK